LQTAIRTKSGCGSFVVTGGPLSSGLPFVVNMIYSDDLPMMEIGGTAVTASVPSATVAIAISLLGGVPDYVLTAGAVSFSLDRTSGGSCVLTVTAGSAGATINGLKLRARLLSIFARSDVENDNDTSASIASYGEKPLSPGVLPELDRDVAQEVANSFASYYPDPRASVTHRVVSKTDAEVAARLARRVSDRITVQNTQTAVNSAFWIETIRHIFSDGLLYSEFGCEKAT